MTPAIVYLQSLDIDFELVKYQHDNNINEYGKEAAANLSVDESNVFKCLMVEFESNKYGVVLVPVSTKLNIKKLLKLTPHKKVKMLAANEIKKVTGYIAGGVSPFGQKRTYATYVDSSIDLLPVVYVSAGKRGTAIKISSEQLVKACSAKKGDLGAND